MNGLKELLEIAIESEKDSAESYRKAAEKTNIFLLKEKFHFLEREEIGHKKLLERIFSMKFPDKKIESPKEKVPFPEIIVRDDMQLSEIIKNAMEAEKWAMSFYRDIEKKMDDEKGKAMARYLASMEESHYYLLKSELEIAYNFELYDEVHEMMHVGP